MADKYETKIIVDKHITARVHIPILTEKERKERTDRLAQSIRNLFKK